MSAARFYWKWSESGPPFESGELAAIYAFAEAYAAHENAVLRRQLEFYVGQESRGVQVEIALGSEIQSLHQERDALRRKRDLAIAHDRQPYPTAEAYENVCAALDKVKRELAELKEKK